MSAVLHTRNLNTRLIHSLVQHVLSREFSLLDTPANEFISSMREILEDLEILILRSEKKEKIRQRCSRCLGQDE